MYVIPQNLADNAKFLRVCGRLFDGLERVPLGATKTNAMAK